MISLFAPTLAMLLSGLPSSNTTLQQVNIVGTDDRAEVETFSSLGPDEIATIYATIGVLSCRYDGTRSEATAILANGQHIITNAHAMLEQGRVARSCTFALKSKNSSPTEVLMAAARFGTKDIEGDKTRDWAIAPLVRGIHSLTKQFARSARPMSGDPVLLVTANGDGKELDARRLVGRACEVRDNFDPAIDGQLSSFFSDCDAVPGDSGGVYLARKSGTLFVVGIHQSGGVSSANGLPYNVEASQDRLSYSMGLAFDGPLGVAISDLPSAKREPIHHESIWITGLTVRPLSPGDQLLYSIPDDVSGALIVSSTADFNEGEVIVSPSIEVMRKSKGELRVSVRARSGQIESRLLRQ